MGMTPEGMVPFSAATRGFQDQAGTHLGVKANTTQTEPKILGLTLDTKVKFRLVI